VPVRTAARTQTFTESMIREMTRVANRTGAVNLAQGFPDFPMPQAMKDAACSAIQHDVNQYAITWGSVELRRATAEKYSKWYGMRVDPETDITVCCGATEAMATVFLALVDPGEEVVVIEPYYENYGPDAILSGAKPVYVPLEPPDWRFDTERLKRAFNRHTRAVVVNTPHNPTGRVFGHDELALIAELCVEHDALAFTDEIYEHILYEGEHHVLATFPGMHDRTVTISGLSKTFSCTGWRLGYAIAPQALSSAIRKVHDFLTVGAPAPLQQAGAIGMAEGAAYYEALTREYRERRDLLIPALREAGFLCVMPEGSYYVLADFSNLSDLTDVPFAMWLAEEVGIATVPGSTFYHDPEIAKRYTRFAFCKKLETLERAAERLATLAARV
jgi:aminotransferase